MFEIISWGEKNWIELWLNYNERKSNYMYFLWILIWPFLEKFWFNSDFRNWNENYLVFQSLILNCDNYDKFSEFLDKNWYEVIWKKIISFKIRMKDWKETLEILREYWDDIDIKKNLNEVEKWNLFFWFLPWIWNEIFIIFAKYKTEEITFITSQTKWWIQKTLEFWELDWTGFDNWVNLELS